MIESLADGFAAAFTVTNLLFICCGIVLGIVFGVLPGLGSVTAIAIMVPITFYMSPVAAIAFLVGVNKGGTSGGAIPAILINAPGTPEAAATARDGAAAARAASLRLTALGCIIPRATATRSSPRCGGRCGSEERWKARREASEVTSSSHRISESNFVVQILSVSSVSI